MSSRSPEETDKYKYLKYKAKYQQALKEQQNKLAKQEEKQDTKQDSLKDSLKDGGANTSSQDGGAKIGPINFDPAKIASRYIGPNATAKTALDELKKDVFSAPGKTSLVDIITALTEFSKSFNKAYSSQIYGANKSTPPSTDNKWSGKTYVIKDIRTAVLLKDDEAKTKFVDEMGITTGAAGASVVAPTTATPTTATPPSAADLDKAQAVFIDKFLQDFDFHYINIWKILIANTPFDLTLNSTLTRISYDVIKLINVARTSDNQYGENSTQNVSLTPPFFKEAQKELALDLTTDSAMARYVSAFFPITIFLAIKKVLLEQIGVSSLSILNGIDLFAAFVSSKPIREAIEFTW
jgi:hypothetical protein